jgi:TonB family protein
MNVFGSSVLTLSRICDGTTQWIWYPGAKTYGGTLSPQIGVCAYPLNEWPALTVSLHAPVVVGTNRVTVDGGGRPCTIVRGELGSDSKRTMCIDTERKLILRYEIENAGATEAFTFHVLNRDAPIDAEILQFHAPLDAQPPIPGTVVAPVLVARTSPRYSDEALQARYEGRVVLSLTITADGFVDDIKVTSSPGMGLDEKAIECVKAWKWRPGMKDGQTVAVQAMVEVNFRLIDTKR